MFSFFTEENILTVESADRTIFNFLKFLWKGNANNFSFSKFKQNFSDFVIIVYIYLKNISRQRSQTIPSDRTCHLMNQKLYNGNNGRVCYSMTCQSRLSSFHTTADNASLEHIERACGLTNKYLRAAKRSVYVVIPLSFSLSFFLYLSSVCERSLPSPQTQHPSPICFENDRDS